MLSLKFFPSLDPEDRRDFLFYLVFFFGLIPVTRWGSSDMILILLSGLGMYHIYMIQKTVIDPFFFYVLIFWMAANFSSWAIMGDEGFKITTFVGSCLKLFLGYSIMKVARERFLIWYEHLILLLALVSLFGFLIQLTNHRLFSLIPFNFAETGRLAAGHWNGIIFNFSTYHIPQNSGFVGEPGTFGYYIGTAMIFNLMIHQGKVNGRFFFLLAVGLTSVSTNFYISILILSLYFLVNASPGLKLIATLLIVPSVYFVYQLPFVGEKINLFISETNSFKDAFVVTSDRINRMAIFLNDIRDLSKYPFGYGVNESGMSRNVFDRVITGTNGISRIAVRFGVFGIIYFLVIYFKLFRKLSLDLKGNYIFVLILLMYIGANPMERDYNAMGMFWLFFLIDKDRVAAVIHAYHQQKEAVKELKDSVLSKKESQNTTTV